MRCPQCQRTITVGKIQNDTRCELSETCALKFDAGVVLTQDNHAFNEHWEVHEGLAPAAAKLAVAREFLRPLEPHLAQLKSATVLDSGCGNGVHARVLDQLDCGNNSITTACLDISRVALGQVQREQIPSAVPIQGDMLALPFPDATFDATFSFGSLMYTGNPRLALQEMARVTKVGGWVGIWAYPPPDGVAGWAFLSLRKLCELCGIRFTRIVAHLLVPFLGMLPTRSRVSLRNANWRQCLEVVLVNLAPVKIAFESEETISSWFQDSGIEIVVRDERAPITIWGRRIDEGFYSQQ